VPQIQPNFGLTFAREGIDPYRDRFEITLRAEGTIRGTGGVRIVNKSCRSEVDGLYVIGDTATREPVAGAVSGGGAINSSWALSSGLIAGQAAADRALSSGRRATDKVLALGQAGLRPSGEAGGLDPRAVERAAQAEILPFDKIYFRNAAKLSASASRLETLWRDVVRHLDGRGRDAIRAREAASIVATARWVTHAALGRTETRGMHHRIDFPETDARFARRQVVAGLDQVKTWYESVPAKELEAAS
jgi:succinate dehydrogenase/fumarate reductase flavoprotein subunit